ncbi:MAG: hypothetical protein FJX56_08425 [Alphaproteobacteria bacterium]|nr:hypothetical protein [Alphaproteobacteria bacterium]
MDIYHVWCDLRPGVRDLAFAEAVQRYLGGLKERELIAGFRLTRRKLGLGPPELGEWHIMIEVSGLAQLDQAFAAAAARAAPTEGLHHAVNSLVQNARFALYRDFPDPIRQHGQELF